MTLQERLDRIREGFEKQAPPEVLEIMHGATEWLRNSGIIDGVVGVGQHAPAFALQDTRGRKVTLTRVLERGPLVLTFFRGDW